MSLKRLGNPKKRRAHVEFSRPRAGVALGFPDILTPLEIGCPPLLAGEVRLACSYGTEKT